MTVQEPESKRRKTEGEQDPIKVDDVNIQLLKPLVPPACLLEDIPLSDRALKVVVSTRQEIANILKGKDDRIIVVVGPCSIHDPEAAIEYANRLIKLSNELEQDLRIVMRCYFEKPRTTVGWKGLINDPNMDGSFQINKGLRIARKLLLDVLNIGLPTAVEFLDTISPQFIADEVCWGAIGARTIESQLHRELVSGLSMVIGLKNGTSGSVNPAVEAMQAASKPHSFLSVTKQGMAAIVHTAGNQTCHIILRGGSSGPNYQEENVNDAAEKCKKLGLNYKIMVDCSHGNSQKDHKKQVNVARDICRQISNGSNNIFGLMIESNLVEGNQTLINGESHKLVYGKSITDACIDWASTETLLYEIAQAVRERRTKNS